MKNLNQFLIEIFASFTFLCLAFPGLATGAPFAYITNASSNTVSVIDTASNTVIATVAVGVAPQGVAVHPDGSRVYVANSSSNTISVIDTATNTVVGTVPVGMQPYAFGQFIGPMVVRYPLGDGISRPFVTGSFGGSATDIKNSYKGHLGEDYRASDGTPVYAFAAGQVCKVGSSSSWGNYVIIKHTLPDSTNVHSLYAHLQEAKQSQDANVPLGELIGLSGHTGGVPAHLHFGILIIRRAIPVKVISGKSFQRRLKASSLRGEPTLIQRSLSKSGNDRKSEPISGTGLRRMRF
jgi:YVTN family beta-propeller protein